MRDWLLSLRRGLGFFTRLPSGQYSHAPLADSAAVFPIVGLVIGLLASLVIALGHGIGLPSSLSVLLGLTAAIIITGGLHEDGLADTADALGARGGRERRIAVLKDSRIGAFGAMALILSLTIKWSALAELSSSWQIMSYFMTAHILGRGILPMVMRSSSLLSSEGQAAAAGVPSGNAARTALILSLVLAILLIGPIKGIVAFAAALVAGYLLIRVISIKFGGYNGDVLGAIEQAVEIAVLINLRSFSS